MTAVERKFRHLDAKLKEWRAKLDRATTAQQINEAVRMVRLYESAIISFEEEN